MPPLLGFSVSVVDLYIYVCTCIYMGYINSSSQLNSSAYAINHGAKGANIPGIIMRGIKYSIQPDKKLGDTMYRYTGNINNVYYIMTQCMQNKVQS